MSGLRQSFLALVRTIGNYSGCHQRPERSSFIHGKQFPVCARCTGVGIGQFVALILAIATRVKVNIIIPIASLGIMGIDWGIQECGLKESTNRRRLVTGILGGFGLFTLYIRAIQAVFHMFRKKNND